VTQARLPARQDPHAAAQAVQAARTRACEHAPAGARAGLDGENGVVRSRRARQSPRCLGCLSDAQRSLGTASYDRTRGRSAVTLTVSTHILDSIAPLEIGSAHRRRIEFVCDGQGPRRPLIY
jgi:hypothetical protein